MSQEYGLPSEGDFHAFFNICEDILHEELNQVLSDEGAPANFDAFLNIFLEDSMEPLATVNVAVAAYTTAQARLRLLDHLQPLGNQVLHYDTDSVIYSHAPGQYEPPIGNFLGDLTDELDCYGAGSYITEFVCGDPKIYAYKAYSPTRDEYSHENV
ncbi:hypothetical protein CBL_13843 [Carabus blaptoides fortunei]